RTSLRGAENTIFDIVSAGSTAGQWSEWLRAPLEYAAGAGNLDLVARLQAAGAGGSALHVALRHGHEGLARELLRMGSSSVERDSVGDNPLHLAATLSSSGIVSLLLRHGAPVDALDGKGRTALHLSAKRGSVAPVQALLVAGADLTLRCLDDGLSALDLAAGGGHVEVTRALVQQGVDVNARDSNGYTALHAAAAKDRGSTVDALIGAGADADAHGGEKYPGWTPLQVACEKGSLEAVMSLLKHGADVHKSGQAYGGGNGDHRFSALFLAVRNGSVAIVNALLAAGARLNPRLLPLGESALHVAASNGKVGVIKALIDHGSSTRARNSQGRTALFSAAGTPDNVAAIDALVKGGAGVNGVEDDKGMTPLHVASLEGCCDGTISLLEHGAFVHARDDEENTALHLAATEGSSKSAQALLKYGAEINDRNYYGRTPLALAAEHNRCEVVELLLDAGADVNAPADYDDGSTALVLAAESDCPDAITLLAQRGADVDAKNENGDSALHLAAEQNHVRSVDVLVGASANMEGTAGTLVAAFRFAYFRWKEEGEESSYAEEFAAMIALLKHGADANALDSEERDAWLEGSTPKGLLQNCAGLGCPLPLVQAVLDAGADIEFRDARGCTPLHNAIEQGHHEIFRTLLLHGADPDAPDKDGRTVLHKIAVVDRNRAVYMDDLIRAGASTRTKDLRGLTPLHIAAWSRRLDVMLALLRSGTDVASVTNDGCTPLHLAVTTANFDLNAAEAAEAVELLLRWGADETAADSSPGQRTPAHVWRDEAKKHRLPAVDQAAVWNLLEDAPRDRAWRRRGWLVLCRARPDRVSLRTDRPTSTSGLVRSVRARCDAALDGEADSPAP
ncbi:unnamed protein product, partial [Scytosiphon promiscuus]